jgi:hypothetical protein
MRALTWLGAGILSGSLFACAQGGTIDDAAGGSSDGASGPGSGASGATGATGQGAEGGIGQGAGGPVGPGSGGQSTSTGGQGSGGNANTTTNTTTNASSSSGMSCSENPCKLVAPQCGCNATQACSLDIANAALPRICTAKGAKAIGQTCAPGECVEGALCFLSVCTEFCDVPADCGGSLCFPLLDANNMPLASDANLCATTCDLATSAGCGAGQGCSAGTDPISTQNFSICRQAGAGGDLADCSVNFDRDCQAGFGCFNSGGDVCLKWCKVGQAGTCSAVPGTTCLGLNPAFVLDGTTYGVCN